MNDMYRRGADGYIRENESHASRITRRLCANKHLRSDDVDDAIHEEGRRSGELFLREASDVGSDDRHDDGVIDARAGDDDNRTEAATLVLLLVRSDVEQDNAYECNSSGGGSQWLFLGPEPGNKSRQRRYDKLCDTLNCEVGSGE